MLSKCMRTGQQTQNEATNQTLRWMSKKSEIRTNT